MDLLIIERKKKAQSGICTLKNIDFLLERLLSLDMMQPHRCQENFIPACRKSTVESGVRACRLRGIINETT